jgi:alpha-glucoside transport system substrate-binding protein
MYKDKRWMPLAAVLIMAMMLAACQTMATPTMPAAQEEPPAAEPAPTGEMATEAADQMGGTVSVLAVWGGDELDNFRAMIAPFEEQTGITVEYEGTRDLNAVLTTRIEGGNPPDLAGLPGPGQLLELARDGHLVALNDVLNMDQMRNEYDEGFLQLATVDDNLYGIFIKAAVKSLVWYNPKAFAAAGYEIPATWDEMMTLSQQIIAEGETPWCVGLESGAASGWPGTDWIEDIMLRTAGTQAYDQWVAHEIAWTDPAIKQAWETWGQIVADPDMVRGGAQGVLATNFGESPYPMFREQPGCYLHRQASFITSFIQDQFPDLVSGEDYDFFPFPPIDPEEGSPLLVAGDLFGTFNDTPQSRALMNYLVTAEAQAIWAERGGFLSANKTVDPTVYPDQLTEQIGEMLTTATAVRFDASDLMPEAVNNAFWSGILNYVSDPASLDTVLSTIEATAGDAYAR